MKKIILAAVFALPCLAVARQAPAGFILNGKAGMLNAPAKALLSYRVGTNTITDSADIKNGVFTFRAPLAAPAMASLLIRHAPPAGGMRTPQDVLSFYLENTTITITADDSIKYARIAGSPVNAENAQLKAMLKVTDDKMAALENEYMAKSPEEKKEKTYYKSVEERSDAIDAETQAINASFAQAHLNSYMGLVALSNSMGYFPDYDQKQPLFDKFSVAMKNSAYGKAIAGYLEGARKIKLGATPAFTQNDPDGKPVSLADFKGKYVLVDFWASWCGPCRKENPNVVAAYNKYKDKNFTVLGVSLDRPGKKEAWLEAIKDDGLTWTHVSDLNYFDNAVSKGFGIRAIPTNFLVDTNGKIVGKNLRGEALTAKLEQILGGVGVK